MLRRTLCATGLFLAALLLPAAAQDKKDADKPDPKSKVETKEKLISAGEFSGKLLKVDGEQKQFTVQVTYREVDPNKVQSNQNHLAQRQLEISRIANLQERQRQILNLTAEMQRRQNDIYKQ